MQSYTYSHKLLHISKPFWKVLKFGGGLFIILRVKAELYIIELY